MFGLEGLCCYLPVDMEYETTNFGKKTRAELELESEGLYKGRLERMDASTFVIGSFLSGEHWISVFANRLEEGRIHVTDSFGPKGYKRFKQKLTAEDDRLDRQLRDIQKFFVTMGWGVREIVTDAMERDQQYDVFNCGVYAIEYNDQILREIKRAQNNLEEFQLPAYLEINDNAMRSGVYRWKIAETMLLNSLKQKNHQLLW